MAKKGEPFHSKQLDLVLRFSRNLSLNFTIPKMDKPKLKDTEKF